ncbi:General substrate transporter [Cynara cardunculus var. scolymus]|uniref:General substrate transporter n=1 Tax=Cynara cardunculus var. scolymus TaxID=59895 RepID=A0A118K2Z9_CYNCS|nr:General substrate transporter [Cynara cardunculus var. scolymus]
MGLKVLSALDAAKTQYYHFKAIIIAGMGLFTDSYDLFCIPPIMTLIGRIYYPKFDDDVPPAKWFEVPAVIASTMFGVALMGAVIGQLIFGWLGDRVGRRRVYGISLVLMVLGSTGCGFSLTTLTPLVFVSLGFFRFLLGMGIGGDYPLSATIMSEFANRRTRGAFIAGVFSMQGFGILLSSLVTMTVCTVFKAVDKNLPTPSMELQASKTFAQVQPVSDLAWRLILMIGAIPASMTYYWRMKMPETARPINPTFCNNHIQRRPFCRKLRFFPTANSLCFFGCCFHRFTALVEKNTLQAAKDMEKVMNVSLSQIREDIDTMNTSSTRAAFSNTYGFFSREFLRRHGRDLVAASTNWFLLDIVFYSLNLFQDHAFKPHMKEKNAMNLYDDALQVAKFQAIVAASATIPGYFATVYLIDYVGRVKIQAMGFLFMAISLFTIAGVYKGDGGSDGTVGYMILYGLTFFFSNFGPNTTTFIVPAELFPARFRATCHGISGAVGKLGAITGTVGFLWASRDHPNGVWVSHTLTAMGGVCVLGFLVTYFFTRETMGRSLEENENVDELTGPRLLSVLARVGNRRGLPVIGHDYVGRSPTPTPLFSREFFRRHGRDLIAASFNWFLVDIVFYSLNLFQYHAFIHHMTPKSHMNLYNDALQVAKFQATVAACATIPGYFVAVYMINYVGRVRIQATGFFFLAVSLFTIAKVNTGDWGSNPSIGFTILYGLPFFFSNFGPNTTTFIVPAELFPARFRATCHGISGAVGKVGAIIGSVGFLWVYHEPPHGIGMSHTLMAMGGVCVFGFLVTYFFTRETMGGLWRRMRMLTSSQVFISFDFGPTSCGSIRPNKHLCTNVYISL